MSQPTHDELEEERGEVEWSGVGCSRVGSDRVSYRVGFKMIKITLDGGVPGSVRPVSSRKKLSTLTSSPLPVRPPAHNKRK